MRWLSYFIFAYLMLGVQLGIGASASYRGVAPDLLLLAVVFISLNAARSQALLGSFLLGFFQDLITVQPLGLFAFSYGLVSLLVVSSAESVRRSHPLTHLSFSFFSATLLGMLLIVHDYFRPIPVLAPYAGMVVGAVRIGPRVAAVMIIYTTLLAPIVLGLLQLCQRAFAFQHHGRRRK